MEVGGAFICPHTSPPAGTPGSSDSQPQFPSGLPSLGAVCLREGVASLSLLFLQ